MVCRRSQERIHRGHERCRPGHGDLSNPVAETTRVARSIGITGTPTMLAADGTKVAPQVSLSPEKLVEELAHLANNPVAPR